MLPLLALLAGGLQALSIARPWSGQPAWWLQGLSLALLAGLLLRAPRVREAALCGLAFALAWLAGSWWWLFVSMHVYGGLPAPLAAVAVLALASALGLYYAAAAAAARWLAVRPTEWGRVAGPGFALAFAGAWLLAELMRGRWFTGFPWAAGGYAHVDGPLATLAPWLGVYGIGFVAALAAAWLALMAQAIARRQGRGAGVYLGLLVATVLAAVGLRGAPAGDRAVADPDAAKGLSVALLQGNIPQDEKFRPGSGVPQALAWYREQLKASRAELVVAPETALPLLPHALPPGYLDDIAGHVRARGQAALVGLPLGSYEAGYTNSVLGLRPRAEAYRYDKHHLVPFGEFIPPMFRWFTRMMDIPLGDFARGPLAPASFSWRGQRLAPNVCYEDLFGEELAARFADPAAAPTILVNLSNIAWFGDTVAVAQHLQISRMRALELRRPMLRATNTGATVVIDHLGRVTHALAPATRGVLEGQVQGREGLTPFARWAARWGLWPMWALGLGALGAGWVWAQGARRPGGRAA